MEKFPTKDDFVDMVEVRYDVVAKILHDLRPGSEFVVRDESYEGIQWISRNIDKPSKEEFENRKTELTKLWETDRYKRYRRTKYPSWEELADAIYHKEIGDDSKMKSYIEKLEKIKKEHPKK